MNDLSSLLLVFAFMLIFGVPAYAQSSGRVVKTYWVATNGNDSNDGSEAAPFATIQKGADSLSVGDTLKIKGGVYKQRLVLTRSGTYLGRPITIEAVEGEEVILDAEGLPPPARPASNWNAAVVDTNGHDHINIRGLFVRNDVACGIAVNGSWQVNIENCRVDNVTMTGIMVDKSAMVKVLKCEVSRACRSGEETVSIKRSQDVEISDCHIHHTGHEGIDVKEGSKHVRVRRNHVHDVERQALYADAWESPTSDIRFESNIVHDCMFGLVAGAETGGLLSDVWFVNNLVYNVKGPGMIVQDWGGNSTHAHPMKDIYFLHNTVVNAGNGGRDGGWGGGMVFESTFAENVVIANNILANNPQDQFRTALNKRPKSMRVFNNLVDGPSEDVGEGLIKASVKFTNPSAGDFSLAPGSPGIDAGATLPEMAEYSVDLAGKPRVSGKAPDLGAFELSN